MRKNKEYFRGCLIGGAIGDAMGWPVEFLSLEQIKRRYSQQGITNLKSRINGKAEITDDTQMTLFTAEGIIRAEANRAKDGIFKPALEVYYAYQRWLITQGYSKKKEYESIYNGELLEVVGLHAQRAPGNACLSSLISGVQGTVENLINDSKGCGGVMRVAPIGLVYPKKQAFKIAVDCAAITHGHALGYLSAGVHAYIISCVIDGYSLEDAVAEVLDELKEHNGHDKCTTLIKKAISLAINDKEPIEAIGELGEGWVGEEAIAIAIYCALKYQNDFSKAICAAVNHDGDSDSTGAITGNILGAYIGMNNIPKQWIEGVELVDVITKMACDLESLNIRNK